jgi:hypothetical protein
VAGTDLARGCRVRTRAASHEIAEVTNAHVTHANHRGGDCRRGAVRHRARAHRRPGDRGGHRPRPAQGTAHPAAGPTWFQLKSADLGNSCITEKGTSSAIAGTPCSSNHSDFWKWTSTGQLLNEHSGKCLSVTGTDPGVYVNTCGTNHAQLWLNQPVPVIAAGKLYSYTEFVNVHTRAARSPRPRPGRRGLGLVLSSAGEVAWSWSWSWSWS